MVMMAVKVTQQCKIYIVRVVNMQTIISRIAFLPFDPCDVTKPRDLAIVAKDDVKRKIMCPPWRDPNLNLSSLASS